MSVPKTLKLDKEMENKRKMLVRSFSLAKYMYVRGAPGKNPSKESELEVGAEFLEVKISPNLSTQLYMQEAKWF